MNFNATFIVSIISFLVFVFIMNKILYKPILAIMQKREEYFKNNEEITNQNQEKTDELNKRYEETISQANTDSKNIISKGLKDIQNEQTEAIENAREDSKKQQKEEKEKLLSEKENLAGEFEKAINELSNSISEVIKK